jgi:preprotein translocase subunit SecE
MSLAIYKPGQGYWTRTMSAIGLAVLVLMGVSWLWQLLALVRVGDIQPIYIQAGAAILILVIAGALGFYLIGVKPRVVEFLIATEGEMKKVNWSTRREILGSTWVVIATTIFIAIIIFIFDVIFRLIFQAAQVLET